MGGEGGCLDPVFALMAAVAAARLEAEPARDGEPLIGVVTEAVGVLWDCGGDE